MIISNVNINDQTLHLPQPIQKLLDIFKDTDFTKKEDGVYEIDGKQLLYMVIRSTSVEKEESFFEAHKNYMDLQFIVDGSEQMGFSHLQENQPIKTPYNQQRDITFYEFPKVCSYITVESGDFVLFSPSDLHAPAVKVAGKSDHVLKVVGKIHLDLLQ